MLRLRENRIQSTKGHFPTHSLVPFMSYRLNPKGLTLVLTPKAPSASMGDEMDSVSMAIRSLFNMLDLTSTKDLCSPVPSVDKVCCGDRVLGSVIQTGTFLS